MLYNSQAQPDNQKFFGHKGDLGIRYLSMNQKGELRDLPGGIYEKEIPEEWGRSNGGTRVADTDWS